MVTQRAPADHPRAARRRGERPLGARARAGAVSAATVVGVAAAASVAAVGGGHTTYGGVGTAFAVLEVLVGAEGGVVTAEELLERAWDESADPFTNAVRITVSGLRKRLGEPWLIATVPGVGYRVDSAPSSGPHGGENG